MICWFPSVLNVRICNYTKKKLQMTIKSSCWLPYVIWLKLCMFFSTRPTHCSNGFTARCHAVTVGTNGIRVQMLGLLWDLRRFRDIRQVNLLHPGDQVQHQFLQIVIWTSMVFFCIPKLSCKFWFFKFFLGSIGVSVWGQAFWWRTVTESSRGSFNGCWYGTENCPSKRFEGSWGKQTTVLDRAFKI